MRHDETLPPPDPDEIADDTVGCVTDPILEHLERTATNLGPERAGGGRGRRPQPARPRRPQEMVIAALDLGLRTVEHAALFTHRAVRAMSGTEAAVRSPVQPTPSARGVHGSIPAEPRRSVRSPLHSRPEMVTGAGARSGMRAGPGREARSVVSVSNVSPDFVTARLESTDLRSRAGGIIPAGSVACEPPLVRLGPGSSAEVVLTVRVPFEQARGLYSGQIWAGERVNTTIDIEVE